MFGRYIDNKVKKSLESSEVIRWAVSRHARSAVNDYLQEAAEKYFAGDIIRDLYLPGYWLPENQKRLVLAEAEWAAGIAQAIEDGQPVNENDMNHYNLWKYAREGF